ncbi:putative dehydrogenase [Enterococcus sp. PF1-24]|uniref:Gfo/Idh/MocA family protein n=1 Tax=unclassified Enterococcus TaxID=2608891 RepID=UPI002476883D|nr:MULTISPECIES: Gfo/Idh/MocA family oxidoreductase [unclassified Enterococcus]MDH6364873.1 putative dehydrogenase [Enterococcus sp. PFB1-1]MDH6401974.1 putative dehydrogenase [Enterococcus sp. PF1-24]
MPQTIRYGILSAAQIVPRFVAGVRESQKGEVVAIASRKLETAEKMAQQLAIPQAYGSYQALCQAPDVDIVYIANYNKGHYAAAKLALENQKHVLLEKPFTLTLAEAEALFALAEKNNCFIMEAQKAVFLPVIQQVKQFLAAGRLGKIQWLQAVMAFPNIDHLTWFHDLAAGGGALHGSGSYPLTVMQYLTSEGIADFAGTSTLTASGIDEQCNLTFQLGEKILGDIFLTVNLDLPSQLTIYGEKGSLTIPYFWKGKEAVVHYHDGKEEKISTDFSSEFVFEVNHVNDCLLAGEKLSPLMTKERTLTTVKVVETCYRQWEKK